jgi:hypothetical protein
MKSIDKDKVEQIYNLIEFLFNKPNKEQNSSNSKFFTNMKGYFDHD